MPLSAPANFQPACRARNTALLAIVSAALITGACTENIPRMDSNFNAQALGPAQQFPTPNPSNDQFIWLTQQPLSTVVASNPGGGNWALTVPKQAFLADPDTLHQFLLASSEPFTTSPPSQMNGQFSIRLLGPGKVSFGIRATRDSVASFIGAGELSTSPFGGGQIGMVQTPALINDLNAFSTRDFPVTGLTTYNPEQVAIFAYSIDQASQTFHLSVTGPTATSPSGNRSTSYVFPGTIKQLELWLFLRQPTFATKVFVNAIRMSEI